MADEKLEIRTEQTHREPYDKPTLAKHGELRDLTAGNGTVVPN